MTHYSPMPLSYTDDVRGVVIGGDDGLTLYTFYIKMPPGIEHYIDTALCRNDAEAEAYVKAQYPVEYAMGIEMRVFDKAHNAALAERFNLG